MRAALVWNAARKEVETKLAIFPGAPLTNVFPLRRHRPIFPIAELPNFGLIFGAILWILLFLFTMNRGPQASYGLPIDFKVRDWRNSTQSPPRETLSVYLAAGEKYYVNGQLVQREALREALQKQLYQRVVWIVYFEADYDTLNGDAIYAMDVIQGLGAKLIWITPKMREELKQRE